MVIWDQKCHTQGLVRIVLYATNHVALPPSLTVSSRAPAGDDRLSTGHTPAKVDVKRRRTSALKRRLEVLYDLEDSF